MRATKFCEFSPFPTQAPRDLSVLTGEKELWGRPSVKIWGWLVDKPGFPSIATGWCANNKDVQKKIYIWTWIAPSSRGHTVPYNGTPFIVANNLHIWNWIMGSPLFAYICLPSFALVITGSTIPWFPHHKTRIKIIFVSFCWADLWILTSR